MNKTTRAIILSAALSICPAISAGGSTYAREALTGFAAGAASAVVVGNIRALLPEYRDLHADTGICRDQLQGTLTLTLGALGATALASKNTRAATTIRVVCTLAGILTVAAAQRQLRTIE